MPYEGILGERLDETELLRVLLAVRDGDFTARMPPDLTGVPGKIADAVNDVATRNAQLLAELRRLRQEVGRDGRTAQRGEMATAVGDWRACIDAVNGLVRDMVRPTAEMLRVVTAVSKGDLTQEAALEVEGQPLEGDFLTAAHALNGMVAQLAGFAGEVTRVAREVGLEGRLGGQADVGGVTGAWKELTDSVNTMACNLTAQVRNISEVTIAVANGDLSKKIDVDVRGELLQLKDAINTMVDQLRVFAAEVTRVAREVGTDGKLGGQAVVLGVAGTWKDLTDSVNSMAENLTGQVRDIAGVAKAIAEGDLTKKVRVDVRGEMLELKDTVNTMVERLRAFAAEVTRVAWEVGTEGRLGGQATVPDVAGTWKDLTDSVNSMASNLTAQVRNIAEVTTAVANGDLNKKITVDVKGEILDLKRTVNTMVDRLNAFASEVTRVAREVGTEGRLGGQAVVPGVEGTWKQLTDNVNQMASNLTAQVRNIAEVTTAVANGDLTRKITVDAQGEILELKRTVNTMVDRLNAFASEVTRVAREVGTDGRLGGQAHVEGVAGTWKSLTDSVNGMASNLTDQVRNIANVATAIANGDLARKITVDARGEIQDLKDTVNTMVDQLRAFASEVTRVAREVGTEGRLGGQATVPGVAGVWKDLTDSVNGMASNLTDQVRNIKDVTTAISHGDLSRKIEVEARGEILELKYTINHTVDQLNEFASEVTRVAREVGREGAGGPSTFLDVGGAWKELSDHVNQLAASLRAILGVATAVTMGDLTHTIALDAQGEASELNENLNRMVGKLKEATERAIAQDWLKSNLARVMRMLQGQRDPVAIGNLILKELTPLVHAQQALFYLADREEPPRLHLVATYAHVRRKRLANVLELGEGLVGQAALERKPILVGDVPEAYLHISSGLGAASPRSVVVLPAVFEGRVEAVIELGTFGQFSDTGLDFLEQVAESIGVVLNAIEASARTEELLKQSRALTAELQERQGELRHANEELQDRARQLAERNAEVERRKAEVEEARRLLEEKAGQLALTSRYKSEFLANMSHELRTPLNSILVLAGVLQENRDGRLGPREVEAARNIGTAGRDLLDLINEILDLSKAESRTVTLDVREVPVADVRAFVEQTFRSVAEAKGLAFTVDVTPDMPPVLVTDARRLQQVLKNLLSNAFKFTERGDVVLRMSRATGGWPPGHETLDRAERVVAFEVRDTGIGIAKEQQHLVFEAFQQVDSSIQRKYGGTGLGLAISRELTELLGGALVLESEPGVGSTFTLFLPQAWSASAGRAAPGGAAPGRAAPGRAAAETRETTRDAAASEAPPLVAAQSLPELEVGELPDDRDEIRPGDRVLLVVEDDVEFARVVLEMARRHGFRALAATTAAQGLALVARYGPHAIVLDVRLPDRSGWSVLDTLKQDPATRRIPVHVITVDEDLARGLRLGARGVLQKPAARESIQQALQDLEEASARSVQRLLLVEPDAAERARLTALLAADDVRVTGTGTGAEALAAVRDEPHECVVVSHALPDMTPLQLASRLRTRTAMANVPTVVWVHGEPDPQAIADVRAVAEILDADPPDASARLLDRTGVFLHRDETRLDPERRALLAELRRTDPALVGKRVLVVDDDVRSVFALTTMLEARGVVVRHAENGREALDLLGREQVDIVLMDVMMPVMDGYQAMRAIRQTPELASLPVLCLTAKAQKGDREAGLAAGATDYIAKPVDIEHLLSLLRVWLTT